MNGEKVNQGSVSYKKITLVEKVKGYLTKTRKQTAWGRNSSPRLKAGFFFANLFGNIVKDLLDKNTEKRADIRDFSDFDKTKYVQDFFDLSSITLPYDAASIRGKLVSAKKMQWHKHRKCSCHSLRNCKKSRRGTNYVLEEDDSLQLS